MPTCLTCKNKFEIRTWDKEFYSKIDVPEPKNCPDCRMIRRFLERNPKNLYYRNCDQTGEKTLSQYHKDHPFPVYSPTAWWGDDWDGTDYGKEFDFSRPFFEQFLELKNTVPHLALFNILGTIENSDFNNNTGYIKNCYLIAESDYNEECYYSNLLKKCNYTVDCSVCYEDELCYECIDCNKSYKLFYSKDCNNCRDSYFLENCNSCHDCIGCINQRQKQYMVFNKQLSKEEYLEWKERFQLDTNSGIQKLRETVQKFFLTQPHKAVITEQNENSSGDHLYNSKNAFQCFDSKDLEDCAYCAKLSLNVKSSMDYNSWGDNSTLIYQTSSCGDNCYNLKFCTNCTSNMRDCEYCAGCFSCSDCFGCVGLKKQKYCILNKKYSPEDYQELKLKIIQHMKNTGEYGEFFPVNICPFAYNETMAMDIAPLEKETALSKGYKWYKEGIESKTMSTTYSIPDSSSEITDQVLSETLACGCGKNYKIISRELDFYTKLSIPLPHNCPSCRHKNRMNSRNPLKLWQKNCAKCDTPTETTYPPKKNIKIYCEKCFLEELY